MAFDFGSAFENILQHGPSVIDSFKGTPKPVVVQNPTPVQTVSSGNSNPMGSIPPMFIYLGIGLVFMFLMKK